MPTSASAVFLISAFLMDYKKGSYKLPCYTFRETQGSLDDSLMYLDNNYKTPLPQKPKS